MPTDPLVTFSHPWSYWTFYLFVAWIVVWGTHAIAHLSPAYRAKPWPWWRLVGLALLLFPFIRVTNGILESIDSVAQTGTVARTVPADEWWLRIRHNMVQNFALPLFGLFLATGHAARITRGIRGGLEGMRRTLQAVGMWPKVSFTRDLAIGLAAFLVVFIANVALAQLLSPLRQSDTGDASRVFDAITPLLAVSLALMAGLTEELLYRGVLLVRARAVLPRVPVWLLLFGSSIFFALAHAGYGTIANILFPFLFGLAVGALVLLFGVWPAVIVHTLVNLMVFLGRLHAAGHPWTLPAFWAILLVAFVLPIIYVVVHAARRGTRPPPRQFTEPPRHGPDDEPAGARWLHAEERNP